MIVGIIAGIISGFVACKIVGGEGKGCIINLLLGVIGGFVGGALFDLLGIHWNNGWIGEIGTAIVGAVVFLWVWNKVFK